MFLNLRAGNLMSLNLLLLSKLNKESWITSIVRLSSLYATSSPSYICHQSIREVSNGVFLDLFYNFWTRPTGGSWCSTQKYRTHLTILSQNFISNLIQKNPFFIFLSGFLVSYLSCSCLLNITYYHSIFWGFFCINLAYNKPLVNREP